MSQPVPGQFPHIDVIRKQYMGMEYNDHLREQIKVLNPKIRAIYKYSSIGYDFDEKRLNIEVNEDCRIVRLWYG